MVTTILRCSRWPGNATAAGAAASSILGYGGTPAAVPGWESLPALLPGRDSQRLQAVDANGEGVDLVKQAAGQFAVVVVETAGRQRRCRQHEQMPPMRYRDLSDRIGEDLQMVGGGEIGSLCSS